ncbi:MAG: TusE/DsrC/DsvC family sulfur relay protein [Lysobacterales bacterium]|jgi:tRNA 2-thiouridine synthesizing protein E
MSAASLELPNGEVLALDERGYLLDYGAWSPLVAETMAAADGLVLENDHRAVLAIFREYFEAYGIEPPMRALVKRAKERLGEEKGSSRYLYRLFPDGPGTQACRYAGLPRPLSCV